MRRRWAMRQAEQWRQPVTQQQQQLHRHRLCCSVQGTLLEHCVSSKAFCEKPGSGQQHAPGTSSALPLPPCAAGRTTCAWLSAQMADASWRQRCAPRHAPATPQCGYWQNATGSDTSVGSRASRRRRPPPAVGGAAPRSAQTIPLPVHDGASGRTAGPSKLPAAGAHLLIAAAGVEAGDARIQQLHLEGLAKVQQLGRHGLGPCRQPVRGGRHGALGAVCRTLLAIRALRRAWQGERGGGRPCSRFAERSKAAAPGLAASGERSRVSACRLAVLEGLHSPSAPAAAACWGQSNAVRSPPSSDRCVESIGLADFCSVGQQPKPLPAPPAVGRQPCQLAQRPRHQPFQSSRPSRACWSSGTPRGPPPHLTATRRRQR